MMNTSPTSGPRRLWLLAAEVSAIAAIFWADAAGHIPVSKTPLLVLVAWASIHIRGSKWRDLGLTVGPQPARMAVIGIVAGLAFWLLEYFIETPALQAVTGRYPDLSDFAPVVGNVGILALLLGVNILLAGLGEELVWRGYALSRVAEAVGTQWKWPIALLAVNVAFGLAHSYQGEAGVTQAAVQGVLLGILFLWTGRNLVAPVMAHIVANTCDFLLIFSGHHVGLTGRFPF